MATTKKVLEYTLREIAEKLNLATSKNEATEKGLTHYLRLEHNSIYGGYRVVNIKLDSGAHCGAFGGNGCEPRLSAKLMNEKLIGILNGIELSKKFN